MSSVISNNYSDALESLLAGGIGVLRTDTLYGIVAKADDEIAVNRVYAAKKRTPTKSPIILIDSSAQLFDSYDDTVLERLKALWPGKNSVILPSVAAPEWIVRGNKSVAYRIPANDELRSLLKLTGPLIAPSANHEGLPPAMTIDQAIAYFGNDSDFYINGGTIDDDTPSRLYMFSQTGDMERLR